MNYDEARDALRNMLLVQVRRRAITMDVADTVDDIMTEIETNPLWGGVFFSIATKAGGSTSLPTFPEGEKYEKALRGPPRPPDLLPPMDESPIPPGCDPPIPAPVPWQPEPGDPVTGRVGLPDGPWGKRGIYRISGTCGAGGQLVSMDIVERLEDAPSGEFPAEQESICGGIHTGFPVRGEDYPDAPDDQD